MKKYILEITVFICGAMIMTLELVASRLLAPYFGSSNMVWTIIIGMILFSNSLGYYFGGIVSDKKPDNKVLSAIIFFAGVWVLIISPVSRIILHLVAQSIRDLRTGALLSTILLFLGPTLLLGMVSPFAVKLKIKNLDVARKTSRQTLCICYSRKYNRNVFNWICTNTYNRQYKNIIYN